MSKSSHDSSGDEMEQTTQSGHRWTLRRIRAVPAFSALVGAGAIAFAAFGTGGETTKQVVRGPKIPANTRVTMRKPVQIDNTTLQCAPSESPIKGATLKEPRVITPSAFIDPGTAFSGGAIPAPGNATLTFHLYLKLSNLAGAKAWANAVSDPSSPHYRQYMTPADFDNCFGATQPQLNAVRDFYSGLGGMQFGGNPSNLDYLTFTATVKQINHLFSTQMVLIGDGMGNTYFLPAGQPEVPKTLAPYVQGVGGLLGTVGIGHGIQSVSVKPTTAFKLPKVSSTSAPALRRQAKENVTALNVARGAHTDQMDPVRTKLLSLNTSHLKSNAPPPAAYINAGPCSQYYGQLQSPTPTIMGMQLPWVVCGYTPSQINSAYGITQLHNEGITGKGQTVAIIDAFDSPTISSDINQYANANDNGQPREQAWRPGQFIDASSPSLRDVSANNPCGPSDWQGEQALDIEAVHGVAPDSTVVYQGADSCMDMDLQAALNAVVSEDQANVVSNSWGMSGEEDPALAQPYENVFIQAAAEGIGVDFSSGDNGDGRSSTNTVTPDYPATSPWVTAVGGTSIAIGKDGQRMWEDGWGTLRMDLSQTNSSQWDPTTAQQQYGAGGGQSAMFTAPGYQTNTVPAELKFGFPPVPNPTTMVAMRSIPDVAMSADPNTGFLIGNTQTLPDGSTAYIESRIGGTSEASPLFTGIQALTDQAQGSAVGFANPAIYATNSTHPGAFTDIRPSSTPRGVARADFLNKVNSSDGINISARLVGMDWTLEVMSGYDQVTGVGVPNANTYAAELGK